MHLLHSSASGTSCTIPFYIFSVNFWLFSDTDQTQRETKVTWLIRWVGDLFFFFFFSSTKVFPQTTGSYRGISALISLSPDGGDLGLRGRVVLVNDFGILIHRSRQVLSLILIVDLKKPGKKPVQLTVHRIAHERLVDYVLHTSMVGNNILGQATNS